jgi:hypothetical protein
MLVTLDFCLMCFVNCRSHYNPQIFNNFENQKVVLLEIVHLLYIAIDNLKKVELEQV